MFDLFVKGGYVMYPLLACSCIAILIFVERVRYYRSAHTEVPVLVETWRVQLRKKDWSTLQEQLESIPGMASQVIRSATRGGNRSEQQEKLLEAAAIVESGKLRQYLNYLEAIVTMAPLLGLLGTVTGMISSFSVLSLADGEPFAITGGVGEALIATATGLLVAIIALVLHTYLVQQQDVIISEIEDASALYLADLAGESHEA